MRRVSLLKSVLNNANQNQTTPTPPLHMPMLKRAKSHAMEQGGYKITWSGASRSRKSHGVEHQELENHMVCSKCRAAQRRKITGRGIGGMSNIGGN
jgi:hypothetical protein